MAKLTRFLSIFVTLAFVLNTALTGLAHADYKGIAGNVIYKTLEEKGVIRSSVNFNGDAPCTRAEFYKMALILGGATLITETEGGLTQFEDVPAQSWFAPYIKAAINLKVISPEKEGRFLKPNEQITKADAVRILLLANKIAIPETISAKDIKLKDVRPNFWFAKYVVAAIKYGLFKKETLFNPNKLLTREEAAGLIYEFINKGNISSEIPTITINVVSEPAVSLTNSEIGKKLLDSQKFQILLDVLDKIDLKYVDQSKIDLDKMTYGAIKGMVEKLSDQYTVFQEPTKATAFNKSLTGEFDGIGISIEMINGKIVVVTPIKGSPAEAAGIKPNDIIDKVDDKSVAGKSLDDVVQMIQGQTDTAVKITVIRDGKSLIFTIKRAHIKITSVNYEMKQNNIAYIEIANFTNNTPEEFQNAITAAIKQNPRGFIIDVRNNPGGFLNAAIAILKHFIPKDKLLMTMKTADGNGTPYISPGPGELSQYPLFILINKGSASAAEIMAAAIREHQIGYLVGKSTFGKGTVQELINYTDGSMLKLSIAKWLTPNGNSLTSENPLKPDYEVNEVPDADAQLNKAMDLILNP